MKKLLSLLVLAMFGLVANAQNSNSISLRGVSDVKFNSSSSIPVYVSFNSGEQPSFNNFESWFQTNMKLSSDFGLQLIGTENDALGFTHYRFTQTFKSLPINGTMLIVHTRNNSVESFNAETASEISSEKIPTITEATALNDAMNFVGAKTYKWQIPEEETFIKKEQQNDAATFFPKAELMYAKSLKGDYTLAYRFDIYAAQPLSRKYVIVDAQSGVVLSSEDQIHETNATGSAITAYSGTQTITTDYTGSTYRLRETGRGLGIETYNMLVGTSYGSAVDFTDSDNTWNNVNAAKDQYATDAHFGAEKTYDYYFNTFGRNSVNNAGQKLLNYVHANLVGMGYSNNINAFWDGTRMTYGDGGSGYNPLTAMDITGHEITHGVTQFTANLTYSYESGALNEAFSDIFGTTIEFYATPALADWLIGEDIGGAFRSMSNPNAYGDPDTYLGTNWYVGSADNGGVHTNSGVLNYWYYLLSQGGSGTNDIGNAFNVTGIGLTKAAAIAYRTLSVYLTSGSQYANARTWAIKSAEDLYGVCSPEAIATAAAWYAVGVGTLATGTAPTVTVTGSLTTFCSGSSVALGSSSAANYQWNLNGGAIAGATNQTYTATQAGSYTVSTNSCSTLYTSSATVLTTTTATASISSPSTLSCNGSAILLTATTTAGYKIQWNKNGVAIGGATNSTYSATQTGNYTATISANTSSATTSNSISSTSIPDNNCTHAINTINVTGLPTAVSPSGIKVTLNIVHPYDGDLVIWLETPSAEKLGLAVSVGSSGANFTNTAFTDAGSAQIPASGAPYTGNYKPWGSLFTQCSAAITKTSFGSLGNGIINPNGAWKLHIVDIGAQDVGTLTSWKIDFPVFTTPVPNCGPVTSNTLAINITTATAPTITPSGATTFCSGGSVNLTSSSGANYLWSTGATTSAITVNSTSTPTVTVTDVAGCTGSASQSVTVNPLPTASAISAGGSTTFCAGGNVLLSGNSTSGTWSIGGGTTATLLATTSGDYFTTTTNSCGSTTSNHIIVTVNPLPVASVITAGGSTTFCAGGNVLLSGNSTSGTWSVGGGTTATLSATTSGDYFTTTTNSCGSTTSNHITVSVNPLPTASAITAGGPTIFCAGGNVLLSGNSTSGTWSVGGGTTTTLSATTSGDYFTTTTNSCGSTTSNHIIVTVNPLPVASAITAGGSTTFCAGGNVLLSGNSTSGVWSIGGGTTSTLSATTSGDYFTTTTNSCGSTTSNHIIVTVNPLPTASAITAGGPTTFCAGGNVLLSGNSSSGTWSVGGGTTATLSATASGDYFTTTTNSCGSTTSNHIIVTVNPLPVASVISAGGLTTFCAGGNVLLSGNSSSGTWSVGGGTTATLSATTSGDYFTTTTNGCGSIESNHISVLVNPIPAVDAGSYSSVSTTTPAFALTGTPVGGTFSGTGVVAGITFDPTVSGAGTFNITYFYTDANGCSNSSSANITVTNCSFSVGSISGPTNACPYMGTLGGTASYNVSSTNASSYTWTIPAGATLFTGQGTNTISFKYSSTFVSGTVQVVVTSVCGSPITKTLSITKSTPAVPGAISGPANACDYRGTATQVTYSIAPVSSALSYSWTLPANVTLVSGQGTTSIVVTFGAAYTTSNFSVKSVSGCGNSANKTLSVSTAIPATPGTVTGNAAACPGDVFNYSVTAVANASTYNWTVPASMSILSGQGTVAISVSFNAGLIATDTIKVTTSNGCGVSAVKTKTVARNNPATPSTIVGAPGGNCNTSNNFSVTLVSGMTYNWTAPTNTSITSGQGTNSVLMNFNSSFVSGTLSVNATNGCGTSANRTLALTAKPSTPGTITPSAVNPLCIGTTPSFSIVAVPGSTSYTWAEPTGSTIQSGQVTISMSALIGSTAGNVTVKASNACGISAAKGLAITVTTCVRLEDGTYSPLFSVTPNPCYTCFVIGADDAKDLIITDVLGRKISVEFTQSGDGFHFDIPNNCAAGIYFIRNLRTGQVAKFEKQ